MSGVLAPAHGLGNAKVGQLDLALLAEQYIVRAYVAVDDTQGLTVAGLGVGVAERPANLSDDIESQLRRKRE